MIALDLKPIRMVEGEGFVDLPHYLKPLAIKYQVGNMLL